MVGQLSEELLPQAAEVRLIPPSTISHVVSLSIQGESYFAVARGSSLSLVKLIPVFSVENGEDNIVAGLPGGLTGAIVQEMVFEPRIDALCSVPRSTPTLAVLTSGHIISLIRWDDTQTNFVPMSVHTLLGPSECDLAPLLPPPLPMSVDPNGKVIAVLCGQHSTKLGLLYLDQKKTAAQVLESRVFDLNVFGIRNPRAAVVHLYNVLASKPLVSVLCNTDPGRAYFSVVTGQHAVSDGLGMSCAVVNFNIDSQELDVMSGLPSTSFALYACPAVSDLTYSTLVLADTEIFWCRFGYAPYSIPGTEQLCTASSLWPEPTLRGSTVSILPITQQQFAAIVFTPGQDSQRHSRFILLFDGLNVRCTPMETLTVPGPGQPLRPPFAHVGAVADAAFAPYTISAGGQEVAALACMIARRDGITEIAVMHNSGALQVPPQANKRLSFARIHEQEMNATEEAIPGMAPKAPAPAPAAMGNQLSLVIMSRLEGAAHVRTVSVVPDNLGQTGRSLLLSRGDHETAEVALMPTVRNLESLFESGVPAVNSCCRLSSDFSLLLTDSSNRILTSSGKFYEEPTLHPLNENNQKLIGSVPLSRQQTLVVTDKQAAVLFHKGGDAPWEIMEHTSLSLSGPRSAAAVPSTRSLMVACETGLLRIQANEVESHMEDEDENDPMKYSISVTEIQQLSDVTALCSDPLSGALLCGTASGDVIALSPDLTETARFPMLSLFPSTTGKDNTGSPMTPPAVRELALLPAVGPAYLHASHLIILTEFGDIASYTIHTTLTDSTLFSDDGSVVLTRDILPVCALPRTQSEYAAGRGTLVPLGLADSASRFYDRILSYTLMDIDNQPYWEYEANSTPAILVRSGATVGPLSTILSLDAHYTYKLTAVQLNMKAAGTYSTAVALRSDKCIVLATAGQQASIFQLPTLPSSAPTIISSRQSLTATTVRFNAGEHYIPWNCRGAFFHGRTNTVITIIEDMTFTHLARIVLFNADWLRTRTGGALDARSIQAADVFRTVSDNYQYYKPELDQSGNPTGILDVFCLNYKLGLCSLSSRQREIVRDAALCPVTSSYPSYHGWVGTQPAFQRDSNGEYIMTHTDTNKEEDDLAAYRRTIGNVSGDSHFHVSTIKETRDLFVLGTQVFSSEDARWVSRGRLMCFDVENVTAEQYFQELEASRRFISSGVTSTLQLTEQYRPPDIGELPLPLQKKVINWRDEPQALICTRLRCLATYDKGNSNNQFTATLGPISAIAPLPLDGVIAVAKGQSVLIFELRNSRYLDICGFYSDTMSSITSLKNIGPFLMVSDVHHLAGLYLFRGRDQGNRLSLLATYRLSHDVGAVCDAVVLRGELSLCSIDISGNMRLLQSHADQHEQPMCSEPGQMQDRRTWLWASADCRLSSRPQLSCSCRLSVSNTHYHRAILTSDAKSPLPYSVVVGDMDGGLTAFVPLPYAVSQQLYKLISAVAMLSGTDSGVNPQEAERSVRIQRSLEMSLGNVITFNGIQRYLRSSLPVQEAAAKLAGFSSRSVAIEKLRAILCAPYPA